MQLQIQKVVVFCTKKNSIGRPQGLKKRELESEKSREIEKYTDKEKEGGRDRKRE